MRAHNRARAPTLTLTCTHTRARTHANAHSPTRAHMLCQHVALRICVLCCMSQRIRLFAGALFFCLQCYRAGCQQKHIFVCVASATWRWFSPMRTGLRSGRRAKTCNCVGVMLMNILFCQVLGQRLPENVCDTILLMVCPSFWSLRIWCLCFP